MAAILKPKKFTPEEYLELEEQAEFRNEYYDGYVVAMSGAKINHVRINGNITRALGNKILSKCDVLPTDIKVWIITLDHFFYPDLVVLCDAPIYYQQRADTITNPLLLVEILSDSTETKDRGFKFHAYQTLESLEEYVLISQDKAVVEQFTRQPDGSWKYLATIGLGSAVKFESVNVELTLEEIYQRVEFVPEDAAAELAETEN